MVEIEIRRLRTFPNEQGDYHVYEEYRVWGVPDSGSRDSRLNEERLDMYGVALRVLLDDILEYRCNWCI